MADEPVFKVELDEHFDKLEELLCEESAHHDEQGLAKEQCPVCRNGTCDSIMTIEHGHSPRWHMKRSNSIFIMYGGAEEVAARAKNEGYTDVTSSGYYCKAINMIVGAKDGPLELTEGMCHG